MTILFHILNCPPVLLGRVSMNKTPYRRRSNLSVAVQISSVSIQTDDSENSIESKKILGSGMALKRSQTPNSLLRQPNTIGVIGGVSVYSTLIFLEKLVRWSSKDGQECVPFVVCSDPALSKELPVLSSFHSFNDRNAQTQFNHGHIVGDLQQKRLFLEQSGACCIVMPCHLSHVWHSEVSKGCSLPFLHVGDCVAMELSKADLRPLEAGSNVRIGVLATGATLKAGVYQEKLQSQGFEVVLPDQATMHHIILPAIEAFYRRDITGARNLLRIAVQVLLVRAVNTVILASDEMQGLLPHDDPLLKKCIDPMDALARSTIRWATSTEKVDLEPISIYYPTIEEVSATIGTPMEGLFDGVDVVAKAMAFASAAAQGALAETPIPSTEPSPIEEAAQTERAVKDGSSLMVTPSSIPSSAIRGPDADLSSDEGFKEVLEDSNDEPTMKKRISDSDKEDSDEHETKALDIPEEPKTAADITMPTAPIPSTPTTPISATLAALTSTGPGPILTGVAAPSQFEVDNNSTTVPDPASEAAAFFTRFDQPEVNDLDPADFWGARSSYVDFHGFRVPEECAPHLEGIYRSRGDFMRGFLFGRSAREHFLKLLGSVMNDIEHNSIDTISAEKILQWRAAVQELIRVGFAVEFMLDHLREIARAFFMKKVQPTVDAIDTRIEALKKEVTDLEGRRERLLSGVVGPNRFGDQTLISGLL
ncbi:uncharacterized protein LOC126715345 isoform X2 [Quercus robur]|uniref:uncharacterized protein LOC126715345 isoform X2 n=1 Tax=Quercus robur TaxID=38942 RepID=UPI002161220B|nr:uncharacterized protein LOC126715345 isoform X2 [Quercus robur]